VPVPGDGSRSDYSHIRQDLQQSWDTLNRNGRFTQVRDMYKAYPPIMTFVRHDGLRCCFKCPCRCITCFTCADSCRQGIDVFAGPVEDDPKGEKGRPFNLEALSSRKIGSVEQPIYGGCTHPEFHLKLAGANESYAKMEGPCFFGGWSECCCDFNFPLSTFTGNNQGDIGKFTKQKPASLSAAVRELMTEADVYTLAFQRQSPAEEKATALASLLLIDYILFDGNTEKCVCDDNGCTCYLCYCMLIGKLCPCCIYIPYPKSGN
jgi:hypothetical protein